MLKCRVDRNHGEIKKCFEYLGYSVSDVFQLKTGIGDIIVGKYDKNYLIEIKDGEKPPSQKKLTPTEHKFKDSWKGQHDIIESIEDVLEFDAKISKNQSFKK